MRKTFVSTILLAAALSSGSVQAQDLLAFPGAEGFGRYAKGARAGETQEIYHVTNLNDSGKGSLRDAVSQPNRFVVFDVSGVINLKSVLIFKSNLTIAGQTAPGEGITLYGNRVSFSGANNIIVRYLRIRTGSKVSGQVDAAGVANGKNMMFDHMSVAWGTDENFSINWDNKGSEPANITIQNSIIGQGLMSHACGGLIQTNGGVTLYRNLYIDNKTRNPKVKGLNQFVNNVVYNWGSGGAYILGDTEASSWGVITNNYFVRGPEGGTQAFTRAKPAFQVYQKGNMIDYDKNGELGGYEATAEDFYRTAGDHSTECVTFVDSYDNFNWEGYTYNKEAATPVKHPTISQETTAKEAYEWIVKNAGATLPVRDAVDDYMMDELLSLGTKGKLISSEGEVGLPNGIGYLFGGKKLVDTDNDGIPDVWEEANGLDKDNAADALLPASDGSGYLNIEKYINSIDAPIPYVKGPTAFQATALGSDNVSFRWTNNATDATNIIIEASKLNNENFEKWATLPADATTYKAEGLEKGKPYYFRVKAVKGELESDCSSELKVVTEGDPAPPIACEEPVPSNGQEISEYTQVTLSWKNYGGSAAGELQYTVYLGKSADALTEVAKEITKTSCSVAVDPSTTYYWRVDTKNVLGDQPGKIWSFTTGVEPVREKVAYYSFNETEGNTLANTYSEENQQTAEAKNFSPVWVEGKKGNAVNFATENAAFVQQHYEDITLGDESFSVEFWFKSAGGSGKDWYLLHKGSHATDSYAGATGKWFGIQYNTTGKNNRLTWGIDDNVTKTVVDVTPTNYFKDEWMHLVAVRDVEAKKLYLYLNGELAGSTDDKTGDIGEEENMAIGNCNTAYENGFQGLMDELSIYRAALTAQEVSSHYLKGDETHLNENVMEANEAKAYPLPFEDEFSVLIGNAENEIAEVTLTDMAGKQVYKTLAKVNGGVVVVEGVGALSNGYYVCNVKCGNAMVNVKVFK